MNIGKVRAALLVALVLAGTAGCASGGGSTAPTSAPAQTPTASMPMESSPAVASPGTGSPMAPAAAISIKDFAYGDPITVSPGAVVTVTNMDTAEHTVTADQGAAFDVEVKENGGTATFTAPSQPGTYAFHCTYHPNMHGMLTVK
jgi:plastocyanin